MEQKFSEFSIGGNIPVSYKRCCSLKSNFIDLLQVFSENIRGKLNLNLWGTGVHMRCSIEGQWKE